MAQTALRFKKADMPPPPSKTAPCPVRKTTHLKLADVAHVEYVKVRHFQQLLSTF